MSEPEVHSYGTVCITAVFELSKCEVGGYPMNFISWVYISAKIVG